MRVVTPKKLREYAEKKPNSRIPLLYWYQVVSRANWYTLVDIKKDFNSVDFVGNNRYVFNIKGNEFRLVVILIFISQKAYIRFIGTHKEYDQIDASTI